jgi:hypothetical protein
MRIATAMTLFIGSLIVWGAPLVGLPIPFNYWIALLGTVTGIACYFAFSGSDK